MENFLQSPRKMLNTSQLFRMPWTDSDNAFSWLEITHRCDLNCDYCYQTNDPHSDKTILEVKKDMEILMRLRCCDTMFVSGGEPLLHPRLVEIIELVRSHKVKPVLVTNGQALTAAIVKRLKKAGLFGFILHIDRGQSRPGWIDKTEKELNSLRQHYADMIYAEKGLICGFNTTILPETIHEVKDVVSWTVRNIHKVCTNTLIPVRVIREDDPWTFYVQGKRIPFKDIAFSTKKYKDPTETHLTAQDIFDQVCKVMPTFKTNAFLGGTEISNAPKWVFSNILGTPQKLYGQLGPKAMEVLQNGHHLFVNRFLSFLTPGFYARGKLLFLLSVVDRELRKALLSYLTGSIRNPLLLFRKLFVQSLLILQPQDILPNGEQDLCNGCPNKTVHEERLVPMCRKEEYLKFGDRVTLKARQIANQETI
jgi:hypothetical protein